MERGEAAITCADALSSWDRPFNCLLKIHLAFTDGDHARPIEWLTCLRVRRAVYLRSLPSRRNSGCGLSRIINTMSEGIFPFAWSPSFWNVTFVPDFQPGFTDMLTYLSSFFGVPSGWSTRLAIFIFFTQPVLISSSVTYKSCSTGGSWIFSFLSGVCTLNECDLKKGI